MLLLTRMTECLMFRWVIGLCCSVVAIYAVAQESSPPLISISVRELESTLGVGTDRDARVLRLALRIAVKNESAVPLRISREQFQLIARETRVQEGLPESRNPLPPVSLQPMQETEGWLWFSGLDVDGQEPKMILRWAPEELSADPDEDAKRPDSANGKQSGGIDVDLNEQIRQLTGLKKSALGPQGCLVELTVSRPLDVLSAWAVSGELQATATSGIERILFVPAPDATLAVADEFITWLSTMVESPPGVSGRSSPLPGIKASFKHVSVAGFTLAANRSFSSGRQSIPMFTSEADAVCAALTPLYRFVPLDHAIADLRSSSAGIRRAAMAGAVDRLTSEQASAILEQARSGSEDRQLEVASYLNLIPGSRAIDALRHMCLQGSPRISAAALRALASSRDGNAAEAMAQIWEAAHDSPTMQGEIIAAVVETADDRWVPIAADYLRRFLQQASVESRTSLSAERLGAALDYLRIHDRYDSAAAASLVSRALLSVKNPGMQDQFLNYLLQIQDPATDQVIRACVTERLKMHQVSETVTRAAAQYRDSAWTDALLAHALDNLDTQRPGHKSLQAVLSCASSDQLDSLINRADPLNSQHQFELLQHLSRIDHADWRVFAASMISRPGARSSEVIQLLAHDASEESLQILRERIVSYVDDLAGAADASVEGQHFLQTLMLHLSVFVHPECRRLMNQLARSPNAYVSERAARLKTDSFRRSPAFRLMVEESRLRRTEQTVAADEELERCIEADPLLPDVFVRRASVRMHAGRFAESMADLRIADRLSPEDIEVQSMIALVMVRLDDIEPGLQFAEQVIAMAPRDWTSLYNGACTFSRAMESSRPSREDKEKFGARAIMLLRQTAELKFDDYEHLLQDEDLVALHEHAEWQAVAELVKANKQ